MGKSSKGEQMLELFTINDSKANTHLPPFTSENSGSATRQFEQILSNPNHLLAKYPEDFTLIRIGKFNQESGAIEHTDHMTVCNGAQFKKETEEA